MIADTPRLPTPLVLSQAQIAEFMDRGWTRLRGAFPRDVADRCRAVIWEKIGLSPDDRSGWTRQHVWLKDQFNDGPFAEIRTARLIGACDDLLGAGRYLPTPSYGWWPITFPGFAQPPWRAYDADWHIDGAGRQHRLDSPEQGMLPLFLFSDIRPGDGGTALREGSHRVCARILAAAGPDGYSVTELSARVRDAADGPVVEGTGDAGDVLLCHPFMLHARSHNTGDRVRFLCNPYFRLHEPMRLTRGADRTVLERSIIDALR